MPQSAAQAAAAGGAPLQPGGTAQQPAGGATQQPGSHPGAGGPQAAGLGGQAGEQLLAHLRQQMMEAAAAGGQAQAQAGEGAGAGMPGMPGAGAPQQQPHQPGQAGQVHLEHRLEVPFLPPISVQLLQAGGEQVSGLCSHDQCNSWHRLQKWTFLKALHLLVKNVKSCSQNCNL